MDTRTKLSLIVLAVVSITLFPTLLIYKSANAVDSSTQSTTQTKGWCESQGKSADWAKGCKQGWYQKDHCYGGDPPDGKSQEYYSGFNAGWKHGTAPPGCKA